MKNDLTSSKEDHISQVPALEPLQKLGYVYLSAEVFPVKISPQPPIFPQRRRLHILRHQRKRR